MSRDDYAFPCAGCLCDHCANNLYSSDQMAGEAKIFCYVCEECRYYDGNLKNKDMRCKQCGYVQCAGRKGNSNISIRV